MNIFCLLVRTRWRNNDAWRRRYVFVWNVRSYNQSRKRSGSPKRRRTQYVVIGSRINSNRTVTYMSDSEMDKRYPHLRYRHQSRRTTRCSAPIPTQHHGSARQVTRAVQHRLPRQRQRPCLPLGLSRPFRPSIYCPFIILQFSIFFFLFTAPPVVGELD